MVDHALTCVNHGGRDAAVVCGECGDPLCDDCSEEIADVLFGQYAAGGLGRLVLVLILVVGIPVAIASMLPWDEIRRSLFPGKILPLDTAVLHSSIILGVALLLTVYYHRSGSGLSRSLVVRRGVDRLVCADCKSDRDMTYARYGVVGAAIALSAWGLYVFITSLNQTLVAVEPLRLVAVGAAIYLLRAELLLRIAQLKRHLR